MKYSNEQLKDLIYLSKHSCKQGGKNEKFFGRACRTLSDYPLSGCIWFKDKCSLHELREFPFNIQKKAKSILRDII